MEGTVYIIHNSVNDKKYIGSTKHTLEHRMRKHRNEATRQPDIKFYKAMNEEGADAFTIEPILKMKFFDIKELWMVEDAYIAIHNSIVDGYNCRFNLLKWHRINRNRSNEKEKVICRECNAVMNRKSMARHKKRMHSRAASTCNKSTDTRTPATMIHL